MIDIDIYYFTNKHLLNKFHLRKSCPVLYYLYIIKYTSGNIFDAKHVATMYRNTPKYGLTKLSNFHKIFSYFFCTFVYIGQNQKFSIGKELMVLNNEKQEISFGYTLLTQK
jgi:hemolysin activation/secretion protein